MAKFNGFLTPVQITRAANFDLQITLAGNVSTGTKHTKKTLTIESRIIVAGGSDVLDATSMLTRFACELSTETPAQPVPGADVNRAHFELIAALDAFVGGPDPVSTIAPQLRAVIAACRAVLGEGNGEA